jgi:hyperosmotically inducible periplasmic protein
MDIRPIGVAVWIAAVVAVAACSPRSDEGAQLESIVVQQNATRTAAARQQPQQFTTPSSSQGSAPASVAPGASDPTAVMGAAPAAGAAAADDARITAQVKAGLAAARDLSGARIDVDTRDGVVTLSGPVRSAAIKARASEIARTVQDVRDVNDQLTLVMS